MAQEIVVDKGTFTQMRRGWEAWKKRRPEGEEQAVELYKSGKRSEGLMKFGGAYSPALQSFVIGAAIYALVTSEWFDKLGIWKKAWFLKGAAIFVAGIFLFRKHAAWGHALLGAGGAVLLEAYKLRADYGKDKTTSGPDEEAGRWEWDSRDDGRPRAIGEGRGAHNGERLADRIFEHARNT